LLGVADDPKIQPLRQLAAAAFEPAALPGQFRLVLRGAGVVQQMALVAPVWRGQPNGAADQPADLLKGLAALLLVVRPPQTERKRRA